MKSKSYEAMFILKPGLNNDVIDKALKQIYDIIDKNKGSVDQVKELGKQKLAYPIKKYKEGVYYLLNFHIAPTLVAAIRRSFSLNESILRVLVTTL